MTSQPDKVLQPVSEVLLLYSRDSTMLLKLPSFALDKELGCNRWQLPYCHNHKISGSFWRVISSKSLKTYLILLLLLSLDIERDPASLILHFNSLHLLQAKFQYICLNSHKKQASFQGEKASVKNMCATVGCTHYRGQASWISRGVGGRCSTKG